MRFWFQYFLVRLGHNFALVQFVLRRSGLLAVEVKCKNGKIFFCQISVQIPESEDGGSVLGSSKRSLADTSITSTADLSIFSGGDHHAQRMPNEDGNNNELPAIENLDFDLNRIIQEDEPGFEKSSPE